MNSHTTYSRDANGGGLWRGPGNVGFSAMMMQVLIIYALRNRIESGPVRCYYGDWIVVYRWREVVRKCLAPTRMYQNYMNGFFKAFRVPVRVRYRNGFSLN